MLFVLALMLGGAAAGRSDQDAADAGANPIRKVVTLMQDMQKELEAEGEKEKELYDKFMCFCETQESELSAASEKASTAIQELGAKKEADAAAKAGIEQELAEHKSDRDSAKQDLEEATNIRSKE